MIFLISKRKQVFQHLGKNFIMIIRITSIAILIFSITGCVNLPKWQKSIGSNTAVNFNDYLAKGYIDFASSEAGRYDWYDADYFAKKSIAATESKLVLPEDIADWDIPAEHVHELVWAKKRLDALLTEDVKNSYPEELAQTQVLFDCWVENQEENNNLDDIELCRMDFLMDITELEYKLSQLVSASANAEKENIYEGKDNIYFGFGSSKLGKEGKKVVDHVVSTAKTLKNYLISLGGHADRAGTDEYNKKLSEKRIKSVEKELIKKGIGKDKIVAQSYGEGDPLMVKTEDGVASKSNRRVEIDIKGEKLPEQQNLGEK